MTQTIPEGYRQDAKGRLIPEKLIKPEDKLTDQLVDRVFHFARDISDQIQRFRLHTEDDVQACLDLLHEKYGVARGGLKGNTTFTSFDGLKKLTIQISEHVSFGPELQAAKEIIDTLLIEWSGGASDEIKAIVTDAFAVQKQGQINRENLFRLRRLSIDDERWKRAMQAIGDAVRIESSKSYIRFYERESTDQPWRAITVDLAATKGRE